MKTYEGRGIAEIKKAISYHKSCLKEATECKRAYDMLVHSIALQKNKDALKILQKRMKSKIKKNKLIRLFINSMT